MVKEAEKFADEDKKRREGVETKNQAETMVYQTEKQLKEFEDKVGPTPLHSCRPSIGACAAHACGAAEARQRHGVTRPWVCWTACAQVPAEIKAKVEAKLGELKAALPSDNADTIKAAMNALQQEAMAMGQAMYSQGGAAPGAGPAGPGAGPEAGPASGGPKGDNVIDAEFTDKK